MIIIPHFTDPSLFFGKNWTPPFSDNFEKITAPYINEKIGSAGTSWFTIKIIVNGINVSNIHSNFG